MSITVTVTDMSCDGCEEIVENAVSEVAGVESVEADQETETVTVEGDAEVAAVTEAIDFAGYTPTEGAETPDDDDEPVEDDEEPGADEEADSAADGEDDEE